MKALIIAWVAITAAILWWPTHHIGFTARWVAMPPAMSFEMLDRARKASARPSFCKWNGPDTPCRVS